MSSSNISLKTAVLYIGMVRTIRKTLPYFVKNIMDNKNHTFNVYAVIDANEDEKEDIKSLLKNYLGGSLINVQWFDHNNNHYLLTKKWNLDNILIPAWRPYLNKSGSMLEYYQMLKAYQSMLHYEWKNKFRYDYIFKTRTDTILNVKLDYNWLDISLEEIKNRLDVIQEKVTQPSDSHFAKQGDRRLGELRYGDCVRGHPDPSRHTWSKRNKKIFKLFMATIYNKNVFTGLQNTELIVSSKKETRDHTYIDTYDLRLTEIVESLDPKLIKWYLNNGRYILTIRKNLMYLCRREMFNLLPLIGIGYALVNRFDRYTFNAESQFELFCKSTGLSIFDYGDYFDDSSLYEYQEDKFFKDGVCLANVYCLVRK